MDEIGIVFFDIDGTLVDMEKKEISPKRWRYYIG